MADTLREGEVGFCRFFMLQRSGCGSVAIRKRLLKRNRATQPPCRPVARNDCDAKTECSRLLQTERDTLSGDADACAACEAAAAFCRAAPTS